MMRQHANTRVAVTILMAATLAGCGSSSSAHSSSPAAATATATAPGATTSATAPTTGSTSTATEISTCTSTAARSKLTTSGKATYLALCKRAVNGHAPSLKHEAAQQCQEIIRTTVPADAQAPLDALCLKV